ncbi:uncharacterized protein LOC108916553 isoform X2 [Anoplophora glabripennis]|uniref:uncharacterized protein LOC108916553 isoform X2 n=1 Tax=Anoplophora glabripennis TaxID=217634 RepID=UPI0008759B88|nr:uncharacterized protein LOC108916553 isoform X2 [Anoplophora glabripennis]
MKNNTETPDEIGGKMEGNKVEVSTKPNEFKNRKYFFQENFVNECDAFVKYFAAIKDNGVMLHIIRDIKNMGDYCDLFNNVNKDFYRESINLYNDSIPADELNGNILYASKLVKLINSPDKGRCLVANAVIPKNKTLIFEPPTVVQVKPLCTCVGDRESSLYRCHNCGVACKMFFTCDGCNICVFCSRACMMYAYTNYHRYECYGLQRHFWSMEDTDYSYLSFRMMLYGASKNFRSDSTVGQCYGDIDNNYPFLYMLETNFHQLGIAKVNEILYKSSKNLMYLIMKTTFFDIFKDQRADIHDLYLYIGGLLVKHYCQAQTNNIILKYPNLSTGFGINVVSGTGKAICPTVALLSHACSPNAVVLVYYDSVAVKSIKPIRPGEEITICYKEVDALLTLSERRTITEEIFNFTCKCYFCEYERYWIETPYRCQVCSVGKAKKIDLENGKVMGYCIRCERYFNFDVILDNLKVATICQNLYKATFAIDHVVRLAECYSKIFPSNSWKLLDIYKLLYEKHVLGEEKPFEVMKYGLLTFSILEHYLSRLYVPILVAKVKFVSRVLNMRSFEKLKNVSEDQLDIMKIFVAEVMKMKEDLEFYLPEQKILFHKNLLIKVHEVFKTMQLV